MYFRYSKNHEIQVLIKLCYLLTGKNTIKANIILALLLVNQYAELLRPYELRYTFLSIVFARFSPYRLFAVS